MKTSFLIIIGILFSGGFVGFSIIVDDVYGLVFPLSPEELLEQSQVIFVGSITSVNVLEFEKSSISYTEEDGIEKQVVENYTLSLDEYTVSIEEFVKNPQNSITLTVTQPTTSIPGRIVPIGGFELGDRVLFYIPTLDDVNEYSFESFKIPKDCNANSVVLQPRLIGTDFNILQNGIQKQDNFTANLPITFVFESDTRTLYGQNFDVEIFVSKQEDKTYSNRVVHEKISTGSEICEWIGIAKSEFILDSGKYLLNGNISDDDSRFSFSNQFSVILQSPLKQIKNGVEPWNVKCNDELTLLLKPTEDKPACVTGNTANKLLERDWSLVVSRGTTNHDNFGLKINDEPVYSKFPANSHDIKPLTPENNVPIFWMLQLNELGIEYDLATRNFTNTHEEPIPPWQVCSPLVSPNGTEFFISSIVTEDKIFDIEFHKTKPNNCDKFYPTEKR